MKFTKMHGCGNDYVYVNCFRETVANPGETARFISDRHFGIGSDGLILIKPSERADFEMDMYNSDGSSGAMCGNGIRCVAKYVYDYGLTDKTHISIDTKSGIKAGIFVSASTGGAGKAASQNSIRIIQYIRNSRFLFIAAIMPTDYIVQPFASAGKGNTKDVCTPPVKTYLV